MKLRYSHASPFARKAMVCAHELGLADRIELAATAASPVAPDAELAAENPLGKIPTLTLDDGRTLFDSRVICEYLDAHAGGGLFPTAGEARWTALKQQAIADGVQDALILCRYEIAIRPEEKRHAPWTDGQMLKARQGLAALAAEDLSALTIGSIAAACALGYVDLRFPDDGWRARHPRLAAWYEGFAARASMQATWPVG